MFLRSGAHGVITGVSDVCTFDGDSGITGEGFLGIFDASKSIEV